MNPPQSSLRILYPAQRRNGVWPMGALFFMLLLSLLAAGCGKAHTEEQPSTAAEKRTKMSALTDEIRQMKGDRDKLDEKLKKLEQSYETIRASSITAKVAYITQKEMRREVQQPGFIMSYETTPIYSYILGLVGSIGERQGLLYNRQIDMGDMVKEGDLLVSLNVPEVAQDVTLKKAMVLQMKAELTIEALLETAKANVLTTEKMIREEESVKPRIDAKTERWESEFKRIAKLYDQKVVDKQVLDETKHQFDGAKGEQGEVVAKVAKAKAAHLESVANKQRVEADVLVAKSRIAVAISDESKSQEMLNYCRITAPFDGMLIQRNVHTGHLARPQGGEKGEPLFTIIRMDRMRVFVDVPEADSVYIKVGQKARIRIQAQEFQNKGEIDACVSRISEALDPATRTLRVELELDNAKYNLRPGMYAYAYVPIVYKEVWCIPESALMQKEEEGAFIFRDVDSKCVLTPVRLGVRANKEVQLLKYLEKPANPGEAAVWCDFTGRERLIMNPSGFVDGIAIEQFEMVK